jgi:hypothetical protein
MWGSSPYILPNHENQKEPNHTERPLDSHLRSTHNVSGHHIQAIDGETGHVEDFVIDDENWAIRYVIIDTKTWWPGKKVLVSPRRIDRVSWTESKLFTSLSHQTIMDAPKYTEGFLPTRDYEAALHLHYDRPGYWLDESAARKHFPAASGR